ncbi:MAG TPA: tRNA pseudouridine(13) synthase TruD, partial [Steroidobacteraceae bacterium]
NAVTTQWFSVPAAALPAGGWVGFAGSEFTVLEAFAHHRKLPRGALSENRFLIRIRNCEADRSAVHARLERLAAQGVANYFGAQRFGRAGANLAAAAAAAAQGAALRARRSAAGGFALSAARSLIFNAVLAARIADGSWSSIEPGDIAILDGRGSVFAVDATDAVLLERCRRLEVHPSGPLWGRAEPSTRARIGALERAIGLEFQELAAWLAAAGLEHERRSLRLRVRALQHRWEDQDLILEFALGPGSFATAVLRELVTTAQEGEESAGSS